MADPACYLTEHARDGALPVHRHHQAYASLVLRGGYREASVDGPVACEPGTLLLHPAFHAHGDRFGGRGARVANLALPAALAPDGVRVLRVARLDRAKRAFERGVAWLPELLADALPCMRDGGDDDWQAAFVRALAVDDAPIAELARRGGVSPAHASRALSASHGMPPQLLRRELRWRHALELLRGDATLAEIAVAAGFADQAHLCRITRACSGLAPGALRRRIKCVQDGGVPEAQDPTGSKAAAPRRQPTDATPCACPSSPA
jgi:AraC-like DNA-binding protein